MNESLRRIAVTLIGLIVLACVSQCVVAPQTPPILVPDTPVDYELPASAEILEQKASSADFFGDYSYYAAFKLSDSEVRELVEQGFDWVVSDHWELSSENKPEWKTGLLPQDVFRMIEGKLDSGPDGSETYKYLYKRIEGGQWRLFVVNEERGLVYYYRVSW